MESKKFNLLQEGWIPVRRLDGEPELYSLLQVFEHAPDIHSLAGELPTLDFALLRLILAVLHAALGKREDKSYAPVGHTLPPTNAGLMKLRWKALWDTGAFPLPHIKEYLMRYGERFWLFHPTHPFYQVPDIGSSTDYEASKLNGVLSESSNKIRLFPLRAGEGKKTLTFAEAARWLIYVNGYDDTSAKPRTKGWPSPGAGWLGQLGCVYAQGSNLFETLMLNLVLLPDGSDKMWDAEKPIWHAEEVKRAERTEIVVPNNPSELLTLQSRRLQLKCNKDCVTGYSLLGGDFYIKKEEVFAEQMTLWRKATKKESDKREYSPRRHNPQRQLWRDFSALAANKEGNRRPGVVSWLARLKSDDLITLPMFSFQTAGIKYGDKDFFADDVFGDSLSFSSAILSQTEESWINRILEQIHWTEDQVDKVANLAHELAKAACGTKSFDEKNTAKEKAYYRLDIPFRQWLSRLDPQEDDPQEACVSWQNQVKAIMSELGRELVFQAGPQAYVGRSITENKKVFRYSAPEAYNRFLSRLSQ